MRRLVGRCWAALLAGALVLAASIGNAQQAPTRVALVIANGAYEAVPQLTNPARDGQLIVNALRQAGFAVAPLQRDLTKPQFDAALREFKRQADAADIALIYYAGHGIELEEQNWLLPVDARIADPADALTEGVSLSTVLRYVQGAKRVRVVVLDACRNNPFAMKLVSPTRAVTRGLRPVEGLPSGTIVAYAASFGQEAAEGVGSNNSPFAASLARRLVEPGLEVRFLFASVRDDVIAANAASPVAAVRSQRPWIGAELSAEQIFFVPASSLANVTALAANADVAAMGGEVAAFNAAAQTWTAAGWRDFLSRFPNGRLKAGAEQSLASIERPAAAPAAAGDPLAAARQALAAITPQEWSAAEPANLVSRVVAASSRESLQTIAAQGNARAQFVVGWATGFGNSGFVTNATEYVRLFQLAAAQGDAPAQANLASVYNFGCCGIARDPIEAVRLSRLAAAQGNALGQANLGFMYDNGEGGLAQDKAEAVRLYRLAAAQGNAQGQANLGVMYSRGDGGLAQDKAEAARLYRLAAAQGNATGQANLAIMYANGEGGLARDKAEAMRLYRLAAAQGDARGQVNLGLMYANGEGGLAQDKAEAMRLYRLAAARGDAQGQNNLATMYEAGAGGLTADRTEAVRLYRLAARQGNANARQNLTRLGETW